MTVDGLEKMHKWCLSPFNLLGKPKHLRWIYKPPTVLDIYIIAQLVRFVKLIVKLIPRFNKLPPLCYTVSRRAHMCHSTK